METPRWWSCGNVLCPITSQELWECLAVTETFPWRSWAKAPAGLYWFYLLEDGRWEAAEGRTEDRVPFTALPPDGSRSNITELISCWGHNVLSAGRCPSKVHVQIYWPPVFLTVPEFRRAEKGMCPSETWRTEETRPLKVTLLDSEDDSARSTGSSGFYIISISIY